MAVGFVEIFVLPPYFFVSDKSERLWSSLAFDLRVCKYFKHPLLIMLFSTCPPTNFVCPQFNCPLFTVPRIPFSYSDHAQLIRLTIHLVIPHPHPYPFTRERGISSTNINSQIGEELSQLSLWRGCYHQTSSLSSLEERVGVRRLLVRDFAHTQSPLRFIYFRLWPTQNFLYV